MKRLFNHALISLLALGVLAGCKSSTAFTISGSPGTAIYTPAQDYLGSIPASGQLNMRLPDDRYFPFLLGWEPGDTVAVPFALDYQHRSTSAAKFVCGLGVGLSAVGVVCIAAGTGGCLFDDGDSYSDCYYDCSEPSDGETAALLVGLGLAGLGSAIGFPAEQRLDQDAYRFHFRYTKHQRTNNDMSHPAPLPPVTQ